MGPYVAVILMVGQGLVPGLLDKIGVKPTGSNGYEEFLRAGDVFEQGMYDHLWNAEHEMGIGVEVRPTPGSNLAKQLFKGKTSLDRRRLLVQRFAEATRLLEVASSKPVSDPRPAVSSTTVYPELKWVRYSAHHLVNVAHVQRAAGDDRGAVDTLMMGFGLLDKIKQGSSTTWLMGSVGQQFLLDELGAALPTLSHSAASRLVERLATLDDPSKGLEACLLREFRSVENTLPLLAGSEPQQLLDAYFLADDPVRTQVLALDATARRDLVNLAARRLHSLRETWLSKVKQGPNSWLTLRDTDSAQSGSDRAELANRLVDQTMMSAREVVDYAVLETVKRRLLAANGAVVRYRWEHGRLPRSLEDATGDGQSMCPLSGRPLTYSRLPEGGFSIKSPGVAQMGEITLASRPKRAQGRPANP